MTFTILHNDSLTPQIWRMQLQGDCSGFRPGQFVEIQLPSFYLRRPISVCDADATCLTLIYKVVGGGTKEMTTLCEGTALDLLAPLGNGYDLSKADNTAMLIGGGVGVPPLYYLARQLRMQGKEVQVFMGFNTAAEMFYTDEFETLGCKVHIATLDGSAGTKGFVTDAIHKAYDTSPLPYYYACGPMPMIRSIIKTIGTNGEISMEERMGCGFGVCMGCSIMTTFGARRVCTDGPVFPASELQIETGEV